MSAPSAMARPAWRLALLQSGIFSVVGIQQPFWPLFLQSKSLTDPQIGWLLAAPYLARIIGNPLLGHWVDHSRDRRLPIKAVALLALLATIPFAIATNFWLLLVLACIAGGASAGLIPLADNLVLTASTHFALDYGRIRLWGSFSFIVSSFLIGQMLLQTSPSAILLAVLLCMSFCLFVALTCLPLLPARAAVTDKPSLAPLWRSHFPMFLAATSLIQLSHVVYYGFAAMHWREAGLSSGLIGLLWAEGVLVEITLFATGARLLRRFTPAHLLLASGGGAALRWVVLAFTTDPKILALAQALHALSFAAGHLGAMTIIQRTIPGALSARAQGLYTAFTTGLVPGLGLLGAGALYQTLGGKAFLPMAVAALLSLPLTLAFARRLRIGLIET